MLLTAGAAQIDHRESSRIVAQFEAGSYFEKIKVGQNLYKIVQSKVVRSKLLTTGNSPEKQNKL